VVPISVALRLSPHLKVGVAVSRWQRLGDLNPMSPDPEADVLPQ